MLAELGEKAERSKRGWERKGSSRVPAGRWEGEGKEGGSMVSTALGIACTLPPHEPGAVGEEDIPVSMSSFFFRAQPTWQLVPNSSHLEIVKWFLQNHVPGIETTDCAGLCLVLHSRLSAPSSPCESCSWGETEKLCREAGGVYREEEGQGARD